MRHLYSAVFRLLLPLVFLRLLWRSRAAPAYRRRWGERLGYPPTAPVGLSRDAPQQVIWVHAVSLGETLAARPLVEQLLAGSPAVPILVTTTTPTGSQQVQALFGERVAHVYAPFDIPGAVDRFLERYQPRLLLLMETELWPNLLFACRRRGCPVLLANARLSARSCRGYARFGRFSRELLSCISHVACQSTADVSRFASLGVAAERLSVCGNIKFDIDTGGDLPGRIQALVDEWRCAGRFVIVAASTHEGEEQSVLAAFGHVRRSVPDALLVLVPRHPERFEAAFALCRDAGWKTVRRSRGDVPDGETAVMLGDSLGEMLLLLGTASAAFIGGSLVPRGGHNLLEPAALGVPVLSGPSLFNFESVRDLLLDCGALMLVADTDALAVALCHLASDAAKREAMGCAGRAAVAANRGARQRLQTLVQGLLAEGT